MCSRLASSLFPYQTSDEIDMSRTLTNSIIRDGPGPSATTPPSPHKTLPLLVLLLRSRNKAISTTLGTETTIKIRIMIKTAGTTSLMHRRRRLPQPNCSKHSNSRCGSNGYTRRRTLSLCVCLYFIYLESHLRISRSCNLTRYTNNRKVTIPLVPEDLWDNLQDEPWPYPTTRSDLHRVAVFTDLHDLGYVLTDGVKFGGDFLAYPGDPMLYHAQFVIRVLEQGRPILPCILAAHSRTSHGARKHMVIASVSAEEGEQTRGAYLFLT